MKSHAFKLLAAILAGGAMLTAIPAHADRDDDWGRHGRWEDRDDNGRHWGHHKRHWERDRVVIRERIVERRPVVREYRYYERPVEYYAPAPVYAPLPVYAPPPRVYRRDPAITIGVDIPPLVIPLR